MPLLKLSFNVIVNEMTYVEEALVNVSSDLAFCSSVLVSLPDTHRLRT